MKYKPLRYDAAASKFFFLFLCTMLFVLFGVAEAQQQAKAPLIGFIPFSGDPANPGPAVKAFRERLRELGYEEGRTIMVEYRYPLGRLDQIPSLVEELVRLKVNILVVGPQPAISAAKKITKTTPIVMISSIDPVVAGHVASLSRPGGNITGVSQLARDLSSKRVELLKEVIPRMRRVAILWDVQGPGPKVAFKEYQAAVRLFNLEVKSLELSGPDPNLEDAFKVASRLLKKALKRIDFVVEREFFGVVVQRVKT